MNNKEKDLHFLIANLLRIGVMISMGIVALGLSLYLYETKGSSVNFSTFHPEKYNLSLFLQGLASLDSLAIMTLGVLCLILTPIARVVVSIFGFLKEKDYLYVFI